MPLNDVVTVSISTNSIQPTQAGFGVPLILGAANAFGASTDKIRFYTGLAGMSSDGFATTDPEYLAAQAMFSQNPSPPKIAVGKRSNKPTMRTAITVLQATSGKVYTVNVNGVAKTFTAGGGDTTTSIAAGLVTAIGALTGFTVSSAAAVITITASSPGNWVRLSVSAPHVDLDIQQTNVDAGIAADIAAVALVDSTWYGVVSTFASAAEIGALAAWIEANQKILVVDSQDSFILDSGTSDIASTLKTAAYARSPVMYHPDNGAMAGAAWLGRCLPLLPGSETWAYKTLAGVPAVTLTATQQSNAQSKNANIYYTIAGINVTAKGLCPSGDFIDTVRGKDWFIARLQTRIYAVLANALKVPYTDAGIQVVESEVRGQINEGIGQGYIAPSPAATVVVPKQAAVSAADKASRTLNGVSFSAPLAGAIHSVNVTGTITL